MHRSTTTSTERGALVRSRSGDSRVRPRRSASSSGAARAGFLCNVSRSIKENCTRRVKKNAVVPVCLSLSSPRQPCSSSSATGANATPSDPPPRELANATSHAASYSVSVEVLHALDLVNPCQSKSTRHAFVPTATIMLVSKTQETSQRKTTKAAQHARNHSLWRPGESLVELSVLHPHSLSMPTSSVRELSQQAASTPFFSVIVAVTATCAHHGRDAVELHIGETEELCFPLRANSYEVTSFFPVWRPLGERCAVSPYEVGKIKLLVRFEVKRVAETVDPLTSTASLSIPTNALPPPGRPSFLPVNFADALNAKRKQLKTTVAPENASTQTTDSTGSSQHAPHFDAAASERLLSELTQDPALKQFSAEHVQFLDRVGEGVHSSVHRGRLVDATGGGSLTDTRDVAIKVFSYAHSVPPPSVLSTFRHEYELLERCTRSEALHVVKYLGVLLAPHLAIITEFFPSGRYARSCPCHDTRDTTSHVAHVRTAASRTA